VLAALCSSSLNLGPGQHSPAPEVDEWHLPGHWEGDLIKVAFNRFTHSHLSNEKKLSATALP